MKHHCVQLESVVHNFRVRGIESRSEKHVLLQSYYFTMLKVIEKCTSTHRNRQTVSLNESQHNTVELIGIIFQRRDLGFR